MSSSSSAAYKKTYSVVSVPRSKTGGEAAVETMQRHIGSQSTCFTFPLPIDQLRSGSLDSLIQLSEDLNRLDLFCDAVTKKLARQLADLSTLAKGQSIESLLLIDKADIHTYLTNFRWNAAKYATNRTLRELTDSIIEEVTKTDEALRTRLNEYSALSHSLTAEERKKAGNLTVKSLLGIVLPEHIVESEFLTTQFVVIGKQQQKEWQSRYEWLTKFVVPRSNIVIDQDADYVLNRVVLFKRDLDEFKTACRESRFALREFTLEKEQLENEEIARITAERTEKQSKLLQFCITNFSETFQCWMHIKGIRVYVESVLRYGVPANFEAVIISPTKNINKLRTHLADLYRDLGSQRFAVSKNEEDDEALPYVLTSINMEY